MTDKKRIVAVLGTRPEVIKFITLLVALRDHPAVELTLVSTGQHREMVQQMLALSGMKPDVDLDIMRPNQSLEDIAMAVMAQLPAVLKETRPDVLLVQGDTSTGMAAALCAFYQKIPVGHIEAGLRSGDMYAPFPEEVNRRIISSIAAYHFTPTDAASENLRQENIPGEAIIQTGNTVIDALHYYSDLLQQDEALRTEMAERFDFLDDTKRLVLVTTHRRENQDGGIEAICQAIKILVAQHDDIEVVLPVHPNPNVKIPVEKILSDVARVHLIAPQDYLPFVTLLNRAFLIISDSGGVQEEGPSLRKPVLVMRETTERPEGVTAGVARLVGTNQQKIIAEASRLLNDKTAYQAMTNAPDLYGDGKATARIIEALL